MKISVTQVQEGDYVDGLGTVGGIFKFYREEAATRKSGSALNRKKASVEDRRIYARIVAEQEEQSYNKVLDSIVIYFIGGSKKSFSPDKELNVYKIMREAV